MSIETGKLIKTRLEDLKRTQSWLAEEAGVSDNAVSKWIKTGKLKRENVQPVADLLEITADQLLAGSPSVEIVPTGDTTIERLNAEEKRLVDFYRTTVAEARGVIMQTAKVAPKMPARSLRRPH